MIKVGTTLFLELEDTDGKKRYRSKLLDIGQESFFIDYPVDDLTKRPHFFLPGTQLKVWYLGKDQAIYLFHSEALGKVERTMPMLVIKDPGFNLYTRVQRRQYVRIETAVDVAVHALNNDFEAFTTVTSDLSGGGVALFLPGAHPLIPGTDMFLWLSMSYQTGEIHYIRVKANLIRVFEEKGRLKGSFQFLDISEQYRQRIVRFCFEKQLAFRKRENSIH